jgi:hypothetical protein
VPSLSSEPPLASSADVLALLFATYREDVRAALAAPPANATDILTTRATQLLESISSEVSKVVEELLASIRFNDAVVHQPRSADVPDVPAQSTARLTIGKRISDRAYLTFSRSLATINDRFCCSVRQPNDGPGFCAQRIARPSPSSSA